MRHEKRDSIKKGDKLIFVQDGHVLSTKVGNVFTFSNWSKTLFTENAYWQCEELLLMGNQEHSFSTFCVELFDENIHKDFVIMDVEKIKQSKVDFIKRFGGINEKGEDYFL